MLFRSSLALLALCCLTSAHVLRFAKISGGSDTTIENYPWQVALLKVTVDANNTTEGETETDGDNNEQAPLVHYCNGAIIAQNAILTSAHCARLNETNDTSTEGIVVRVGSADRNNGGALHTVERTLVHPEYNDTTFENDLAILFLADHIPFSASARNVTWANSEIVDDEKVTLTSWENQVEGDENVSEVLQAVILRIVNQEACIEEYQLTTAPNITENMLCAGNDYDFKGFTQGDIGSPLVQKFEDAEVDAIFVLQGIASFSRDNRSAVFVRISNYAEFISSAINEDEIETTTTEVETTTTVVETTTDDGEETTTDDGEETTTDDGEETTTDDGEETTTDDGEETTTDDGEETTTDDGEETTTDDGGETTTDDGEETTTEDSEFTSAEAL